tara:strand:+ start:444 stop:1385 length:942 start_codon:yes stop_codon:yes gene_type:complete
MKFSFVVPTYREELNIERHYQESIKSFYKLQNKFPKYESYEYLVIDNCSDDKTVEKVLSIREKDNNVKLYVNEKNYGPIFSPLEGLIKSSGDVACLIAADLQEPPNLIMQFAEAFEEGYEAAIGIKANKKENILMWNLRGIYYATLKAFGLVKFNSRYSGFGLYSRKIIDKFSENNLDEPSLRILLPTKTDKIKSFKYFHAERARGISSYNIFDYVKEALKTIIRNTTRIPSFAGIFAFILTSTSFILIFTTLIRKILFWNSLGPGIATILILMLIFNSGFCILISIILDRQGQILSRLKPIKKEVKHKTIYN